MSETDSICFHCEAPIAPTDPFIQTVKGPLCMACEPEFEFEDDE